MAVQKGLNRLWAIADGSRLGMNAFLALAQAAKNNGGGLDICFLGGLEVDCRGNVNAHQSTSGYVGIGGFANITHATRTIVFRLTFTAKGLAERRRGGEVEIVREGTIPKFKREISAISFSAKNARRKGQRVLYVTERCVFELAAEGLRLLETYPGVDPERDIARLLDFRMESSAAHSGRDG
jgi:propionate CoA-transferase